MGKKNRERRDAEAVAALAADATEVTVEAGAPAPEPEKPATRTRYALTEAGFGDRKVRRGFETVLAEELKANGGGTVEEITQRLLDSGKYQEVAPMAAAARPTKPVAYLLKIWATAKVLHATELEVEAAPAAELVGQ
jgi:hypothetical protein